MDHMTKGLVIAGLVTIALYFYITFAFFLGVSSVKRVDIAICN